MVKLLNNISVDNIFNWNKNKNFHEVSKNKME